MQKAVKLLIVIALLFSFNTAWADVRTTDEYEQKDNTVYIVGNKDLYPIEFLNQETNCFEGVLPELLKGISERTGYDFVYVHSDNKNRVQLTNSFKAQLNSAYNTDQNETYYTDIVTFVSYKTASTTMNVGWRFTEFADRHLIDVLKIESSKVNEAEINALLMNYTDRGQVDDYVLHLVFAIAIVVLLVIIFVIMAGIIKFKKSLKAKEITDITTGIGNLTYFENKFSKINNSLNYIAYFIVDSNYLQVYHSETTFADAIKYMANTLSGFAIENEIVARITENGFAYVFNSDNDKNAREHINDLIKQLSMFLDSYYHKNKFYFRVVIYHLKEEDKNSDLLIFNLRRNCTKLIGTEKVLSFCADNMMNSALEKKQFIDAVNNAFKNKDFKMYLQFVYDNKTNMIVSAEALSRWDRGEEGIMFPGSYIGEMEKNGVINKFDYYMFEQTCMQLHKWKDTEFGNLSISCNVTRITISDNNFVERILEIANKYVFDKTKLIIEITEDALEKDRDIVTNNILRCKEFGFRFALDDLGSGYTSLTNLCDYPFDIVKIDRSILLKTDNDSGKALYEGIEAFAHKLGLKIVCEGIETDSHREYVSQTKCDYVQGWYFCKAAPVKEAEQLYLQRK